MYERESKHAEVLLRFRADLQSNQFRDELVKNASVGGRDAAHLLRKAVADYTRGLGMRQDIEIVVYIYANVYNLLKLYHDLQLVYDHSDVKSFINGFNMGYPLLNFVDAGNGKECAEDKLCTIFKLNAYNMHCKHLILGTWSLLISSILHCALDSLTNMTTY